MIKPSIYIPYWYHNVIKDYLHEEKKDMNENKKEYSVIGTVTIGTDEYRDLLTDKFEAEKRASEEHDHWYKTYCEKTQLQNEYDKLMNECKTLKEELDKLKKLIKKNPTLIGDDGVTVFMSMFGEE